MNVLHIYRSDNIVRVRRRCPYCKRLCYGSLHNYYDGSYFFFDCGTKVDCEGYTPPPKKRCAYCRKWFRPLDMEEHLGEYHRIGN